MAAFVAGLTQAMDSESNRAYQRALMQEAVERQKRLAAQEARIAEEHQRQRDLYDQDKKVGLSAIKTLAQMQLAPPPGAGPQSPPPGQASVPMMIPPAGPMGPPSGMEGPAPMGTPEELGGMPPPPPPAAISPSWSPSAAAPEELGGPPPPVPGEAPPPGAAQIGAPPAGPQLPSKLPPQWLSVPNAVAAMDKAGIPLEQQYQTLGKLMPIIQAQNKEAYQDLQLSLKVMHAMNEAKDVTIREFRARNPRPTADMRNAEFASSGAPGADLVQNVLEKKGTLNKNQRPGATGGASAAPAAGTGLTPDAIDIAAAQFLRTGQLPPMYKDVASRKAIMNRAGEMSKEGGGDAGDVPLNRASFKADAGSLNFATKRVDQIDTSIKKIEKDTRTLESVLDKGGSWTGAQFVNVPLNALRRQFNDPNLAKLDLAAKQVGVEYERMINGGLLSVAQLHEGAREDAAKIINGDMPAALIRAKLPVMQQEMNNAKTAAQEQAVVIRGRMSGGGARADTQAASSATPAKIKNDAEYNALPSGATFIAPDGSTRKKP